MKVLVIGQGGREAAMAHKIASSARVNSVVVSPGNPGMLSLSAKISLKTIAQKEDYLTLRPDLVVIGPETPLSEGLTDFFESWKIPVVGPSQKAALLEGSKAFCKEIFKKADIPTPAYEVISSMEEAKATLSNWKKEGVVVKVDSLAQGKGVIVCSSQDEALRAVKGFLDGTYLGYPVEKILLEEKITGPEVSVFALCDGENFITLGSATDYKRLLDDDLGPNTGGMGTISPSPVLTAAEEAWVGEHVFAPTLKVMKERGTPFKGFLFAGLMKTDEGLKALEFNTRLGDPETQSLLPRLSDDLVPLLIAAASGKLKEYKLSPSNKCAIHVVLAARGYPGTNGQKIESNREINVPFLGEGCLFFTAGVTQKGERLFTSGGRVCGVTVVGSDLSTVRKKVYQEIKKIQFEGAQYRSDIGEKFL